MKNQSKLRSSRNGELAAAIASIVFALIFFAFFFVPNKNETDPWFGVVVPSFGTFVCLLMAWNYFGDYKKTDIEWRKTLPQVECPDCGHQTALFERPLHIDNITEQSVCCSCGFKAKRCVKKDQLGRMTANVWE